ncbi:MAG: LIC11966 family surface protein [Bacteroidia bacterium]
MKKLILSAAVASTMFLASCGVSKKDAMAYNDRIVAISKEMDATSAMFISQIDGHNIDSLKLAYGKFDSQAGTSLEECKNMKPFAKKTDFKDAAVEYFTSVKKLVDNEAKGIVGIMSKDSSQITEQDVSNVKAFAATYDTEYTKALQKVQDAQVAFAKEFKFAIEDTK